MARPLSILGGILLSFSPPAEATAQYSIIPEPSRTELKQKTAKTLQLLSDQEAPSLGTDAYRLTVTPQGAHLASGGREGRIYGLATLRQLRDQLAEQPEGIPCGIITDKPRYPWRGLMVDPARHFIPIKDLEKFVDLMAYYKFNRLHLHLTDNQGWRLPVPGYPKLKSIASRREESFEDGIPHEGIYTKQELKELVAYCAARGIEAIPEIDVPGHNQALHAAYPEFFCFPKPDMNVRTTAGNSKELVCPQKPEVWKFYAAVFKELKDIFPSGIVHLGGDEAPTELWEKCPLCRKARTKAGMKDEQEQMRAFFAKTTVLLAKNGQTPQFWYEGNAGIYHPGETVYADHVEPQPDEDARLIGKFLQKDGGENGKHRIGPIEGNLNSGGFRSIDHEYFAECRNQVVRHVVQEAPQRKTGDQHEERQPVLFGNDRHGRGTVVIHIAFVNFSQGRRCVNLETEKSPEIIQPVDKKIK